MTIMMFRYVQRRSWPVGLAVAVFALVTSCLVQPSTSSVTTTPNKLLLLLIDGFRWNYFDKFSTGELPGFTRLRQDGVTANGLVPVCPTLSLVNYYSLMTGLYPETHGVVGNYMYDEKHDTLFLFGENPEQYYSYWWDDGQPLWISATKQHKRSYFWYWNGCEVEIRGHRPTFCSPYQSTPNPSIATFSLAVQDAVSLLRNDSADVAGVYLEHVDSIGHTYGPNSDELKAAIREVDAELDQLLDALSETSNINLMVFSDHGMIERVGGPADASRGLINVLDYISSSDWEHAIGSKSAPVLHIWPKPDKEESLYNRLRRAHPHLTVYKKQDIPERYHLKNHYRVPPLLVLADAGYAIVRNKSTHNLSNVGYHGYDNKHLDMDGILLVAGPDFKRNARFKGVRLPMVNVYQLMCHVMQLVPEPHNGVWSAVCDALADDDACVKGPHGVSAASNSTLISTSSAAVVVVTSVITYLLYKKLSYRRETAL